MDYSKFSFSRCPTASYPSARRIIMGTEPAWPVQPETFTRNQTTEMVDILMKQKDARFEFEEEMQRELKWKTHPSLQALHYGVMMEVLNLFHSLTVHEKETRVDKNAGMTTENKIYVTYLADNVIRWVYDNMPLYFLIYTLKLMLSVYKIPLQTNSSLMWNQVNNEIKDFIM